MRIADPALEKLAAEGSSLRIRMIGAGFVARRIANQIINSKPGLKRVAIANRALDRAADTCRYAGVENFVTVDSKQTLEDAIANGRPAITDNAFLLA